jgi:hypothetical protein
VSRPVEISLLEAMWILGIHGAEQRVAHGDDPGRAFAEQVAAERGARFAGSPDVLDEVERLCTAVTARGRSRVKLWGTKLLVERDGQRRVHELGAMRNIDVEHAFAVVAAAIKPEQDVMALVPGGDGDCRAYVVLSRSERAVLRRRLDEHFDMIFRKLPRLAPPRLIRTEPAPRSPRTQRARRAA